MKLRLFGIAFLCSLLWSQGVSQQGQTSTVGESKRARVFDDRLGTEDISEAGFSPDGQMLAIIRARPLNALPQKALSPLDQLPREDIWLQEAPGKPARKLTDGETDASKWWLPAWSPDGKRLAFLSTRGDNMTLWVWEKETNKVRQVSKQGVFNVYSPFRAKWTHFMWAGNDKIIFLAPLEGTVSRPDHNFFAEYLKRSEDVKASARNGEVTASAIDGTEFRGLKCRLMLVDLRDGVLTEIAKTVDTRGPWYPVIWPAPTNLHVAVVTPDPVRYNLFDQARIGSAYNIEIRSLTGEVLRLNGKLPENVHTQSIKWSPDGKELAFFANGSEPINPVLLYGTASAEVMPKEEWKSPMENPAKLYRVNVAKKTIEQVPTGEIDLGYLGAPDFLWNDKGELIFNAPKRRYGTTAGPRPVTGAQWGSGNGNGVPIGEQPPKEWLVLKRDGTTRLLNEKFPKITGKIQSINGGSELLMVAGGELILMSASTGAYRSLTDNLQDRVLGVIDLPLPITGPDRLIEPNEFPKNLSHGVVEADGPNGSRELLRIDLRSGVAEPIQKPNDKANLTALSYASGSGAFVSDDGSDSTSFWRTSVGNRSDMLLEMNTFRRSINNDADLYELDYTMLDGRRRTQSYISVPADFKPGRKYPVLINVYPQLGPDPPAYRSDPSKPAFRKSNTKASQIWGGFVAENGFIFVPARPARDIPGRNVLPSQKTEEGPSCSSQINTVVPLIDKLIEAGVADPDRIFVEGSSMGGWASLCVIAFTTRFKAAIASASDPLGSDIEPLATTILSRYSDNPAKWVSRNGPTYYYYTEVPWWRDSRRERNDPMSYADRIQTPLIMFHGELDAVPIERSERMFNALVSMRKPVEMVRYWGEGHGNRNPNNVRDMAIRSVAWFDRWGDIARDEHGNLIWDGERVASRKGKPQPSLADYGNYDFFRPSPGQPTNTARKEAEVKPVKTNP